MDRTEHFLARFNELEQFLREETNSKRDVPFGGLIGRAAHLMPVVNQYVRELREWADLRNAIVHEHPKGRVIAEITYEALHEFERLVDTITAPETVFPRFRKDVRVFAEGEPLIGAVEELWSTGRSQVIARADEMMTLLSYAGITHWLGSQINGTTIELSGSTVGDALTFEQEGGIAFLPRTATVAEARQLFLTFPDRLQQRLRVIVITENGKSTEAPIGLITASDLVEADI